MDIFTKLNIYRNAIRHINFYFSEEKKENALPGKMMGEILEMFILSKKDCRWKNQENFLATRR